MNILTTQSVSKGKVLAKNIPHPFGCYRSTTQLIPNPNAFIEGEGSCEHYSWNSNLDDFGVDDDVSPECFDYIGKGKFDYELYENHDSYTVVIPLLCQGFRLPKKYFKFIVALTLEDI